MSHPSSASRPHITKPSQRPTRPGAARISAQTATLRARTRQPTPPPVAAEAPALTDAAGAPSAVTVDARATLAGVATPATAAGVTTPASAMAAWQHALARLRAALPESAFEHWILPLHFAREGERWLLRAPGRLLHDRVRLRYLKPIRAALAECDATLAAALQLELGDATTTRAPQPAAAQDETPPAASPMETPHAPLRPAVGNGVTATPNAAAVASTAVTGASAVDTVADAPNAAAASSVARAGAGVRANSVPVRSFRTFVVGPANQLAREATLAVAEGREPAVSPLYLVGPMGNGKSHLAQALAREASLRGGAPVYRRAEAFTNEFQRALHTNQREAFRRRFRRCRLLVLDDVNFVAGKTATQEELFHTVEHLLASGGRVVLTGDRLPAEMPKLHPGLASQLGSGLVATLDLPSRALRRDILRAKAAHGGVRVPDDCIELLADALTGSVRELVAGLMQVVVSASLCGQRIDCALVEQVLRRTQPAVPGWLEMPEVLRCVCEFFGVSAAQLRSRSRARAVALPRQVGMYLCHRYTRASFSEIGRHFGRNHSSVKNAVDNMDRAILERAPVRYRMEELVLRLGNPPSSNASARDESL